MIYIISDLHGDKNFKGLQEYLRIAEENVTYRKWHSGHWHRAEKVDEKHELVYDTLMPVDDAKRTLGKLETTGKDMEPVY